jgi:SAM-dependent methyltransferase
MNVSTAERQRIYSLTRERSLLAGHALEDADADRMIAAIERMPEPPCRVLDVGCGAGVLVDVLADLGFAAQGIDIDESVMASMQAPHSVGSIDAIPAGDRSVDVVVVSEVLEHLPVEIYARAIQEIARVAGAHVIVTVPNSESLESASTRCPQCMCVYSIHGHVRRFERADMPRLIPGFALVQLTPIGPQKMRHRSLEWVIRRRLLGRWPAQANAVCPQCGFRQPGARIVSNSRSILGAIHSIVGAAPWRRWWMIGTYDHS